MHPIRESLNRLIDEQPGLNIREISQITRIPRGTVRYHIRRLIDDGHVETRRHGHHLLHFSQRMPQVQQIAISLLRINSVRAVVEAAMEDPEIDSARLASELGISTRSIQRSIRILVKAEMAQAHNTKSGQRSVRLVKLHQQMRITWVRWCEQAEGDDDQGPLWKAPGWVFAFESFLFGQLLNASPSNG